MKKQFTHPIFVNGDLEFRFEDGIICIYGTAAGLTRLSDLIQDLVNNPGQGHIHLENPLLGLLTRKSEKAVIAIFDAS